MINPIELRKYNLFYFENINVGFRPSERELIELKYFTEKTCVGQDFDCALYHEVNFEQVVPIELSGEWLIKANAIQDVDIFHFSKFTLRKNGKQYDVYFNDESPILTIYFLHQLQNLYYDLTNQELKLN
jgi:hypothetical protein